MSASGFSAKPMRRSATRSITSKFGFNIDPRTGERVLGVISRPDHIKEAVEGMLGRLRTDRIDLALPAPGRSAGPGSRTWPVRSRI